MATTTRATGVGCAAHERLKNTITLFPVSEDICMLRSANSSNPKYNMVEDFLKKRDNYEQQGKTTQHKQKINNAQKCIC